MSTQPPTLSVLTLNVWGLKFISKDRTPRIAAIAEYLATHSEATAKPGTGFEIVCLQECWVQRDFETIKEACKDVFPYSRYFHTYVVFLLCGSCRLVGCCMSCCNCAVISLFGIMALICCLVSICISSLRILSIVLILPLRLFFLNRCRLQRCTRIRPRNLHQIPHHLCPGTAVFPLRLTAGGHRG
jgi:hypothetical protein